MVEEKSSGSVFLGVDLSSKHIRYGTIDNSGKLLNFRRESHDVVRDTNNGGRVLADKIISYIQQSIETQENPIAAIGIGFPGLVNHNLNRIVRLPNAPSLVDIDLFQELTDRFGLPVIFENNTHAATIAEMRFGVAQGINDWLNLRIGNGVGAGLVLDGKLRRGKSGYAGEIGHMNIDPEGIECGCGSRGCLETIAAAPNIVRRTRARLKIDSTSSLSHFERHDEDFTYSDIITAALDGDELAILMMQRTGYFIGMAVADTINLLNLSMVVISGNSAARQLLVPAIREEAQIRSFPEAFADCEIVAGKLGSEAGVIGAAMIARDTISA